MCIFIAKNVAETRTLWKIPKMIKYHVKQAKFCFKVVYVYVQLKTYTLYYHFNFFTFTITIEECYHVTKVKGLEI